MLEILPKIACNVQEPIGPACLAKQLIWLLPKRRFLIDIVFKSGPQGKMPAISSQKRESTWPWFSVEGVAKKFMTPHRPAQRAGRCKPPRVYNRSNRLYFP